MLVDLSYRDHILADKFAQIDLTQYEWTSWESVSYWRK